MSAVLLAVLSLVALLPSVAAQCMMQVPADPLSVTGLSSPFIVSGVGCTQSEGAGSFAQAVILDVDTGAIYAYSPLVVDAATPTPAAPITVPTLPKNYVAAIYFGSNSGSLTLLPTTSGTAPLVFDSLSQGACINGGGFPYSIFGQYSNCNGAAFFNAAYNMVNQGKLVIPPLGNDFLGNPCPTTHDFSIVDQDQSDNCDTKYILTAKGTVAQLTPGNLATLNATGSGTAPVTIIDNGSDELLITLVRSAIGCSVWTITDLADPTGTTKVPTVATNELQATLAGMPRAFVPALDPMVINTNTGLPDINKLNAYRSSVGQSSLVSVLNASTNIYCNNLYVIGAPRIIDWFPKTYFAPPPDFAAGLSNSLGGVLVVRYQASVAALGCANLIGINDPLGFFQVNPTTLQLILPPSMFSPTTAKIINGMTSAQLVGVQNLQVDNTGQTTFDIVPQLANNNVGTTTSTTAFSGMWFGIGFAIGAVAIGIIVGVALTLISRKGASSSHQVTSTNMARF